MNDKSYVSLEQRACLVCGAAFDTGAVLLDKRLRASMKRHTVTGWGCVLNIKSYSMTALLHWLSAIRNAAACTTPTG